MLQLGDTQEMRAEQKKSGDLSKARKCILEHHGYGLDTAIRSGLSILHADLTHDLCARAAAENASDSNQL
jgi:hypothetical protein